MLDDDNCHPLNSENYVQHLLLVPEIIHAVK